MCMYSSNKHLCMHHACMHNMCTYVYMMHMGMYVCNMHVCMKWVCMYEVCIYVHTLHTHIPIAYIYAHYIHTYPLGGTHTQTFLTLSTSELHMHIAHMCASYKHMCRQHTYVHAMCINFHCIYTYPLHTCMPSAYIYAH